MTDKTPAVHEALAVYAPETVETVRVPPGYKQTEVGVIPEDWEISTVGEEFDIKLGKMLDSEKNSGTLKPYLGNKAIQWDDIRVENLPTMAMSPADIERFRLRHGDLLVCEGGEVGRAALWESFIPECYYQKALHRLRPRRRFNTRLMLEFLRYWTSQDMLTDFVSQTSIAHLTREKFATVPLPVPPLHEQRAIAAALSDVDALISGLDKLIAKKRAIKTAAMQQLLTGKQRLPGFSGEWEVKRLGEIAHVNMGQSPSSRNYNIRGVGLPLIQGNADIENRRTISRVWTTQVTKSCDADDLVLTVRAPVGYVGVASKRSCLGRGVCSVRPAIVEQQYLFHALVNAEPEWRILEQGSTFTSANSDQISKFEVMCPESTEEQTAIATVLSDMDEEISALEGRREKTRRIKQAMMQELLTGRTRLV